jgi:hypothetical protein
MATIDWALYTEKAVGRGSSTFADVVNRPLREVMTISGADPDATFVGFSLVGHTHSAADVVSGTLLPARGGTGLSSPTAKGLLVAAGVAAMTLIAPPAAGQVVRSNGTDWVGAPIVTADVSDLATAATGITKLGTISQGAWNGTAITDTYLATISTAGKVTNAATTATALNTASAIVARDSSGNFAAGTITAAFSGPLAGTAALATALATPRAINGVNFDGTAPITVAAAAGTLTGTTLAPTVTASSLTSFGTLTSLGVTGTVTAGAFSGPLTGNVTGNASTATMAGTVTTAAQPTITSVGTLTSLAVSGTVTLTAAVSKIVPGATSFSHRNSGDTTDNVLITDAGAVTVRGVLILSAGLSISANGITVNSGTANLQAITIGGGGNIASCLTGTVVWDPPSLANGASASTTITVTGAAVLLSSVVVGTNVGLPAGFLMSGAVTSANTVTLTLLNASGGTVDVGNATWRADVWQH